MSEKSRPVSEGLEEYLALKKIAMMETVTGILSESRGYPPYSNYSLEGSWTQKTNVTAAVGVFVTGEGIQTGLFDFFEGEIEGTKHWNKVSKLKLTDRLQRIEERNYFRHEDRPRRNANEKYLKPQCRDQGLPLALLVFGTREDGDSAIYLLAPPNLKPSEALELIKEEAEHRIVSFN